MTVDADVVALIPAAGGGTRLGLGPKALLTIDGETLLARAIASVRPVVARVLVGVPPADVDEIRASLPDDVQCYAGGRERLETIRVLAERTTERFLLVHDAARPFASTALVRRVIETAQKHGAAVACRTPPSAAARMTNGMLREVWSRNDVVVGETPFCIERSLLMHAVQSANDFSRSPWEVLVQEGTPVHAIPTEETNIKITTPLDWRIATEIIAPLLRVND